MTPFVSCALWIMVQIGLFWYLKGAAKEKGRSGWWASAGCLFLVGDLIATVIFIVYALLGHPASDFLGPRPPALSPEEMSAAELWGWVGGAFGAAAAIAIVSMLRPAGSRRAHVEPPPPQPYVPVSDDPAAAYVAARLPEEETGLRGYCSECGEARWLTEDGACPEHGDECVSRTYRVG